MVTSAERPVPFQAPKTVLGQQYVQHCQRFYVKLGGIFNKFIFYGQIHLKLGYKLPLNSKSFVDRLDQPLCFSSDKDSNSCLLFHVPLFSLSCARQSLVSGLPPHNLGYCF